jgi:ribosomal protein S27AE
MHQTKKCPKCQSGDLIKVLGNIGPHGNNIPMGFIAGTVMITRYVCGACGFSEEWIESKASIEALRKQFPQ